MKSKKEIGFRWYPDKEGRLGLLTYYDKFCRRLHKVIVRCIDGCYYYEEFKESEWMKNKKLWSVGLRGSTSFSSLIVYEEDVKDAMLEMAKQIAGFQGLDPRCIRIYGGPNKSKGWRACPKGDKGWGWPYAEPADNDKDE